VIHIFIFICEKKKYSSKELPERREKLYSDVEGDIIWAYGGF
jgi:hypothetical protein